ncbi:MAG: hypothetical protein FIB07_07310 [Candidatus Methanoperedens sp.]|nr:hypothetical protein [Candidatus Methanoperedens sp.]
MQEQTVNLFLRKLIFLLLLILISGLSGCIEPSPENNVELSESNISEINASGANKNQGMFDNADRLYDEYKWKLDLVTEIQNRTDAMGTAATKEMYIEWKRRNNEAIDEGERLANYITENRDILGQYWTSDILVLIAKNKVTFERDNQNLEQIVRSTEAPEIQYSWKIDYYGTDGGEDLGIMEFENQGKNLSNIKFRFEFYQSSGEQYSTRGLQIGDVASGATVRKKISIPARYYGTSSWSTRKVFIYINETWKEEKLEEIN